MKCGLSKFQAESPARRGGAPVQIRGNTPEMFDFAGNVRCRALGELLIWK
jgi:hypothetical protein|tara:strand:+ start:269 stop:418 length:150 start_codon:yes stop_codon:yes gene_type:complete